MQDMLLVEVTIHRDIATHDVLSAVCIHQPASMTTFAFSLAKCPRRKPLPRYELMLLCLLTKHDIYYIQNTYA